MREETVHPNYMSFENWSDSSTERASLLALTEDWGFNGGQRLRGSQNYLARQAFLRSYQFCVEEETFKGKMRRKVRRLNEEPLEEIVKQAVRKAVRATKSFVSRHYEVRKTKQTINSWPASSCFQPSFDLDNPVAPSHALSCS